MTKINFKTAFGKKNGFDRSSMHITTLDFGKPNVSNIFSVNKGDSVHVNLNQFMRLSPLAVPTYGNIKLTTRAFFVPNRILTPNWQAFYSQSLAETYKVLPYFTLESLWNYFVNSSAGLLLESTAENYDFKATTTDVVVQYYTLTDKGRFFYQILLGLGYSFSPVSFNSSPSLKNFKQSFLPLLAYLRIYNDVLYPSRFLSSSYFGDLFVLNQFDENTDAEIIFDAFAQTLFVPYENDFFCNTWASFNSPNGLTNGFSNQVGDVYLPDLSAQKSDDLTSGTSGALVVDNSGTFARVGSSSDSGVTYTLSSYGHRLLDSLSDFVLRNNLAGSRFLDYVKAHFGYTTDSERINYAQFLGSYVSNSNIMDVTSTAETLSSNNGDVLGAQAGKGYINGQGRLSFDVPEVGFIIFISYLSPSYGYYQGQKPWCAYKESRLDYYNPDFDNIGNEPIPHCALVGSSTTASELIRGNNTAFTTVFGFAPRYSFEYKNGHDFLTGDFRCLSRNKGLDSFHTFRNITYHKGTSNILSNNLSFHAIDNQYDRIFSTSFNNSDKTYDHFIGYFQFSIKVYSNMRSISESLPFYEDEGKNVSMDQS